MVLWLWLKIMKEGKKDQYLDEKSPKEKTKGKKVKMMSGALKLYEDDDQKRPSLSHDHHDPEMDRVKD